MRSINEVLEASPTPFTGSEHTRELVAEQVERRFGPKARKEFDPYHNCRTFAGWLQLGYRVKAKEKALQSVVYIEKKDSVGNVIEKYPRKISLFFVSQVAPVEKGTV